ncbi:MAG TPA: DUF4280 domain-containing protein [Fimbriimonadaceae bacterium]|nr:DUF4280 domain-containing protein [Fimbriimonadaceae bacterium]
MPQQVVNNAATACTFGLTPSTLAVTPMHRTNAGGQPAANIMDHIPMTNIVPFGMCSSLANPEVASATSAAQGVLTPQPCVPVVPGPWAPGCAKTILDEFPSLDSVSTCNCTWGGVISITFAGQATVMVD